MLKLIVLTNKEVNFITDHLKDIEKIIEQNPQKIGNEAMIKRNSKEVLKKIYEIQNVFRE